MPKVELTLSRAFRLGKQEIGVLAAVVLAALLLLGFGLLAEEVMEGETKSIDLAILQSFRTVGNPADLIGPAWLEEAGRDVTALGSFVFLGFLLFTSVGYLLLIRKRGLALLMGVTVLSGMLLSTLLKSGFDRPRPDIAHTARVFTASFPSGHAALSAVVFLTLGALLTRTTQERRVKVYFVAIAVFLTIVVGLSRIYLGVHYPTDVIAGWCIGTFWAVTCWTGALWLQLRGSIEKAPSSDHVDSGAG